MKKAILIIENNTSKIAEQLLDAFESRQAEGTEIIIAKTQQAADAIIAQNKDIYAVISTDDLGSSKITVLNDVQQTSPVSGLSPSSTIVDSEAANCEIDFYRREDSDRERESCRAECTPAPRYDRRSTARAGSFTEILAALEEMHLIKSPGEHVCEKHEETAKALNEVKTQLEVLRERMQHTRQEIDNCPARKRFFDKPADDSADKKSSGLSVAFLTFAGVALTAALGLLGKLFEVLFSYLKLSGGN